MNQLHPRQDGSAGARSVITRRDLMRRGRPRATGHRPKAGAVFDPAAVRLHRRKLGKVVSWTGRERLRFVCYRLGLAFAPRGGLIRPGDPGSDQAPGSLSRPC